MSFLSAWTFERGGERRRGGSGEGYDLGDHDVIRADRHTLGDQYDVTPPEEDAQLLDFDALARECGLVDDDIDADGGQMTVSPQPRPRRLSTSFAMMEREPEVRGRSNEPAATSTTISQLQGPVSSWRFNLQPSDLTQQRQRSRGDAKAPSMASSSTNALAQLSSTQTTTTIATRPARGVAPPTTPTINGVQLYHVLALHGVRSLFGFPVFNAMQSTCLPTILYGDEDVVVSAPTGSGKTVLFELAIVRMLQSGSQDAKAVYLAPTKALVGEKMQNWSQRFQHQGCAVVELTGDTFAGLSAARKCRLIVSTPEKWDSLTRRWHDHSQILSTVQLMLLDEVHILNEPGRGARVEVIVSRTKTYAPLVRFVAVSATIPNLDDVAVWIGGRPGIDIVSSRNTVTNIVDAPARVFRFDDTFRPCPLEKFVYSYPQGRDEFSFQSMLNHKLFDLILQHGKGRPSLVFVSTRKATAQAAEVIAERYRKVEEERGLAPWPKPGVRGGGGGSNSSGSGFADAALDHLASLGIAFHHAGLSYEDRKEVERRFLAEEIRVLCSTSTLAVGINLPAYCVVIRGTKQYSGNQWAELGDLDVIQMMGRAGRPQFDRDGVAVIMCEQQQRQRFEDLVGGGRDIESTLGDELIEHINAEIGLGSIRDVSEVERWLRSTFYAVRLRKKAGSREELDALVSRVCSEAVGRLDEHRLIQRHGPASAGVESTEAGTIMSRYFLSFNTMLRLLRIEPKPGLTRILEALSQADEFADLRIRQGEKAFLKALRTLPEIRFPPKAVNGVPDKVSILIQATLAGINIQSHLQQHNAAATSGSASFNVFGEIGTVFRHAPRICKAMLDLALDRNDGAMAKATFELLRSLSGKAWDGSPAVLRQLEGIGEKSIKALAAGGFATLAQVAEARPHEIELLLNRNPPFGSKVIKSVRSLPRFELTVAELRVATADVTLEDNGSGRPAHASVTIEITVGLRDFDEVAKRSRTSGLPIYVCVLTLSSELDLLNFSRLPISKLSEPKGFTVSCSLTRRGQKVVVLAASDEIPGSSVRAELRPDVPDSAFPRPSLSSFGRTDLDQQWQNEQLLQGLDAETDLRFDDIDGHNELDGDDSSEDELPLATKGTMKRSKRVNSPDEPPQRLANGNYRCRHSCKGQCRHLCCREGMPKPPKRTSSANKAAVVPAAPAPPSSKRKTPAQAESSPAMQPEPPRTGGRRSRIEDEQAAIGLLEKIDRLNRLEQQQNQQYQNSGRAHSDDDGAMAVQVPTKRRRAMDGDGEDARIAAALASSSDDGDLPLHLEAFFRRRQREAIDPIVGMDAESADGREAAAIAVDEAVRTTPPSSQPLAAAGDQSRHEEAVEDVPSAHQQSDSPPSLDPVDVLSSHSPTPALPPAAILNSPSCKEGGETAAEAMAPPSQPQKMQAAESALSARPTSRLPSSFRRTPAASLLPRGFLGRIGLPPWSRGGSATNATTSTSFGSPGRADSTVRMPGFGIAVGYPRDEQKTSIGQQERNQAFAMARAALSSSRTSAQEARAEDVLSGQVGMQTWELASGSGRIEDDGDDGKEGDDGDEDDGWKAWINDV